MARSGYAKELQHLRILKVCQGIIDKYLSFRPSEKKPTPTPLQVSKMNYAIELYKKSIPQTTNLDGNLNVTGRLVLVRSATAYKNDKTE